MAVSLSTLCRNGPCRNTHEALTKTKTTLFATTDVSHRVIVPGESISEYVTVPYSMTKKFAPEVIAIYQNILAGKETVSRYKNEQILFAGRCGSR